ncbi:LuxR C-terminal-related transcriptional regulator [Marinobacter profundi]|uniref:Helix-turn-helix transcriptional regulator n=1 Tax=Marinobacter profundi TaxID=2666256 RepID=A0A2G1UNY0_9GAMM|nr:LuxR C-terminal-related transcriptional regulator [Marinobacter profundi]PHQ16172.1 helix-turn-helix transcriptional regulator [Marinobacter profundi]
MLLTTKFLRPTADPRAVARERLLHLLEPGDTRRLNLIVAPAGFGKTTLASQWCSTTTWPTPWLSLDEHDDEPRRLWQYVTGAFSHGGLAGLEDIRKQLARCSTEELEGPVTGLINTLAADGGQWGLVIDDYHLIRDRRIHQQLCYFIDYLPPGVTVTLLSRTEPDLPIARWKVRQWVAEIHPSLLAFSEEECRRFFSDYMAQPLSPEQARKVWEKTEGWVAAMQLSALAGGSDNRPSGAPSSGATLDGRRISDYVLSEVLEQQPPEVRQFLLETAACPRLCSRLCDAVRDANDSQRLLERLLRDNLFVVPLDTNGAWFRYHDLFREALLQRAVQLDADRFARGRIRAIEWLLTHENVQEGISQIVDLDDKEWLAQVLELHGNNLIHSGFHLPVLDWLTRLPVEAIQQSPRLMMLRVWALFFANRVELIAPLLTELEDLLDCRVAESHPDAEGALGLHSEISLIRSYLARTRSDDKSASDLTRQVLQDIDHTRIPLKSVTYYSLGLDYYGKGELAAAEDALRSAVQYGQLERKPSTLLSSGGLMAWIQYNRGDIDLALETSTSVRQWVDEHFGDPRQPRLISCWQNSAMTEIYRERNEPELATACLAPLLEHVRNGTEPGQHVIIQHVRGHLAFSQGRYEEALDALRDAESVARRRREHIVFEPPDSGALMARCYLAMANLGQARQWLDTASPERFRNPLNREQSQTSAARVLVALGRPDEAIERLAPLQAAAERDQHNRQLTELLVVHATAKLALGESADAALLIGQALSRAAEAGFLRLFAEEPAAVRELILGLPEIHAPQSWVNRLRAMLAELDEPSSSSCITGSTKPMRPEKTGSVANPDATDGEKPRNSALPDSLSQREVEVLGLINEGLANKEIAAAMGVAATTVKAHIRNLYSKLAVGSRTEALARARQLGLL